MLIYLFQFNILLLIFSLSYWLLLRRGKLLQTNRLILLSLIVLSFILPALPAVFNTPIFIAQPIYEIQQELSNYLPELGDQATTIAPTLDLIEESAVSTNQFTWLKLLIWTSLVVSLLLLLFTIRQCITILKIIIYSNNRRLTNLTLVHTDLDLAPFSFFRYLILNPSKHQKEDLDQILVHEGAHIQQYHYLDIMVSEFIKVLFWYNPAVWLLNRMIKINLEYLADEAVLNRGIDRKNYQYHLLRMSILGRSTGLMLPINYSPIKKRIAMMNSSKPSFFSGLRYTFLLPIFLCSYFLINPNVTQALLAQKVEPIEEIRPGEEDIFLVIRPDTKWETLKEAQKILAERNIEVKYQNLNFNDGLISSISVSIKAPDYNGNLSYDPLEEPLVFYYLQTGKKRVGFFYGMPKEFNAEQQNIVNRVSGILVKHKDGIHVSGSVDIDEDW